MKNKNYTWDLSILYSSDNDKQIEKDINYSKKQIQKFVKKYKEDKSYLTSTKKLLTSLEEFERIKETKNNIDKAWYYFFLRYDQDSTNKEIKQKLNSIENLETELSNQLTFYTVNISKLDKKLQKQILKYKPLTKYKHLLERLFIEGEYTLTEKEENIISLMTKPAYSNWKRFVSDQINQSEGYVIDKDNNKRKEPFNQILMNLTSTDSKLRDSSAKVIHKVLSNILPIATEELNSILEVCKISDDIRGYTRPDQSRHISDDIDTQTVDSLITSVTSRFDIPQRYYKLRAELLRKRKIKYHERIFQLNNNKREYSFEDAKDIIIQTYNNLDRELGNLAVSFFKEGRIDVFPKKGKRGGAYCIGIKPKLPVYILLNYSKKTTDILTIAHELGHAINNELIGLNQSTLNYGTPISTAEVASTFFEDFVFENITKDIKEEEKLYIYMDKLSDEISTIFRQVALYNFEFELHNTYREKSYINSEEIGNIFNKHMFAYLGEGVSNDKGAENWWVYWGHIRRPFYVYSYASGLLISKVLQNSVRNDKGEIEKVKTFLSTGLSSSPRDIFLKMNIDINDKTFWNKGLDSIEEMLIEAERLFNEKK